MLAFNSFDPYAILAAQPDPPAKPAKDAKAEPPVATPSLAGLATLAAPSADAALWTAAEWQEFFDERTAVAEYCGRMPRDKAARMAYESCVVRWLDTHLPSVDPDACSHCCQPIDVVGQDAIVTGSGHWLHHACHVPWLQARRQEAISALGGVSITASY